jgi:hypothetical protein
MSILYLRSRPAIAFDVNNSKHREYYYDFVKNGTWGHCPVRFMAESLNTDLVTHINQKMLEYYVRQEFENVRKKTIAKKSTAKGTLRTVRKKQSV